MLRINTSLEIVGTMLRYALYSSKPEYCHDGQ